MKLLKLDIKAYGSFAEEESIDFSSYDKNLFVINGATGSGKSTIIDAILFCLSGDAEYKDKASHHRDEGVASVVSLIFSINSKKYQIERKINAKQTAHLLREYKNGAFESIETRASGVNDKIEDILGVKREHLKHMLCLEQGQHLRFLTETDRSKELFLANTFNTSRFERFQKRIQDRYKKETKSLEKHILTIENLLSSVKFTEKEQLLSSIEKLSSELSLKKTFIDDLSENERNLQTKLDKAKKQIELKTELKSLEHQLAELGQSQAIVEKDRKLISEIQSAVEIDIERNNLDGLQAKLKAKQLKFNSYQEEAKKVEADLEENKYALKIQETDALLLDIGPKKEKLERELKSLTSYKEISEVKAALDVSYKDLTSKYDRLKQEILDLAPRLNSTGKLLEVSSMLKIESLRLDDSIKQKKSLQTKELDFKRLSGEKKVFERDILLLRSSLSDLEDTKKASLSFGSLELLTSLRKKLETGESCLLCGSKDHDLDAIENFDTVSEEKLKELEKELARLKKEEKIIDKSLSSVDAKLELLAQDLSAAESSKTLHELENNKIQIEKKLLENKHKLQASRSIEFDLEQKKDELSSCSLNLTSVKEKVFAANEKLEMLQLSAELVSKEELYKSKLLELNSTLKAAKTNKEGYIEKKSSLESRLLQLERFQNELSGDTESISKEASEIGLHLDQKMKDLALDEALIEVALSKRSSLQELKSRVLDFDNKIYSFSKRKKQIEANREDLSYDFDSVKKESDQVKDDLKLHSEDFGLLGEKHANLCQVNKQIEEKERLLGDGRDSLAELKKLYDVINGKSKSMGLHRWILASVLDEILLRASEVLEQFMPSRYRLIRQGVCDDKAISLEVEVIDLITGKNRKIRTLSGGEGFIVSLAFSLGLALVISDKRSFFDIEALFIDEGFGSLDSENLIFVLNVLRKMSDGKKMIGLITHVDMVKEFVSKSINVVPSKNVGSSLTFS